MHHNGGFDALVSDATAEDARARPKRTKKMQDDDDDDDNMQVNPLAQNTL